LNDGNNIGKLYHPDNLAQFEAPFKTLGKKQIMRKILLLSKQKV
jgi:hypothetical protein